MRKEHQHMAEVSTQPRASLSFALLFVPAQARIAHATATECRSASGESGRARVVLEGCAVVVYALAEPPQMLTQSQLYTTSLCARPGLNSVTKASGFWISVKAQASSEAQGQAERRSPERSMSSLISLLLGELGCLRPGFETPPSQPSCLTSTAPALPPSSRHAQLRRAQGKAEGCLQKTWERHQRKRSPR